MAMLPKHLAIQSILLAALCSAHAAAQTPTTDPSKTWELPGIRGTAQQIKLTLHQELDDLHAKIAAAQGDVRSAEAEMQKHRQVVAARLAKEDPTYQYVCKTIADSQQQLANTTIKARADELQIKIDGFTKRRNLMEDQAVAHDADTQPFLNQETQKIAVVDRLKRDLAKAIAWRCVLGAAVRGGETLAWPVRVGETGIIGAIRINHVDPDGVVTAQGALFEPESQDAKKTEGIATVHGEMIPATFIIRDWTDRPGGSEASGLMDQIVTVTSVDGDESGMTVHVDRSPSEDDALLEDFREFRQPSEQTLPQN